MSDRICPLKEAARDAPNQIAVFSEGAASTFSQLDQAADRFAANLRAAGIQPGDRIAISHPPCWEMIALFFAAWRLGAAVCPLHLRLPPSQIAACLDRLAPSLYLTSLQNILPIRSAEPRCSLSPLPALFLFTSGSTGTPKIAVHTLSALVANASGALSALDLHRGDAWLLSLPLYHVGGIGLLLRCLLARAAIVFDERHPGITHLSWVPTQLYRAWPVYRNLRCLLLGGAPLPSPLPAHLPIYATYGLTEMGSMVAVKRKDEPALPLPDREIRIAPDGEILVRGACLFQGYWENGAVHLPTDREGWFSTGDLGRLNEQEGLSLLGRKDWQFISGGENIQPEEIERELLALPHVEEAVVVPRKDPEFGHRPAAAVRTRDASFDLQAMRQALLPKLPKYKIPQSLLLLSEIPKKGLKTDRKQILELFEKEDSK